MTNLGGDFDMEQMLVNFGLIMIGAGAVLSPFFVKKIENNFEAFLLLIGLCAVAISGSWHENTIEQALLNPLVFVMILSLLLISALAGYQESYFKRMNNSISREITVKMIIFGIVVVLGLAAGFITPILLLFVLMEMVTILPLERKTKVGIIILTGFSIGLGAILSIFEPLSTISAAKTLNESHLLNSTLSLNIPDIYLILCILVLGLIAVSVSVDKIAITKIPSSKCEMLPDSVAVSSAKACMFVAALVLAGLAFSPG